MSFIERSRNFLGRVANSQSTRHGLAALGAGIVISLITEAVWPSVQV